MAALAVPISDDENALKQQVSRRGKTRRARCKDKTARDGRQGETRHGQDATKPDIWRGLYLSRLRERGPGRADRVVSNYGIAANGMPYAIAMEKGFFKEEGADVTGILS